MKLIFAYLSQVWAWMLDNRQWLFSGLGLTIFTLIITLIRWIFRRSNKVSENEHRLIIMSKNINTSNEVVEKKEHVEEVQSVAERFLKIYQSHGISKVQIPTFLELNLPNNNLKLADMMPERIIDKLDESLLTWTSSTFGVQREWLDGVTDYIYPHGRYDFYKRINSFIDLSVQLKESYKDLQIYALKPGKIIPNDSRGQDVVLVLRFTIAKLHDVNIFNYLPICTYWDWGYWRTRYQAKAIFSICEYLDIYVHGYDLEKEQIHAIADGTIFPGPILEKLRGYSWYPEDFRLPAEHVYSVESHETIQVYEYMELQGYMRRLKKVTKRA